MRSGGEGGRGWGDMDGEVGDSLIVGMYVGGFWLELKLGGLGVRGCWKMVGPLGEVIRVKLPSNMASHSSRSSSSARL